MTLKGRPLRFQPLLGSFLLTSNRHSALRLLQNSFSRRLHTNTEPPPFALTDDNWRWETAAHISHHLRCSFESSAWLRARAGVFVRVRWAASGLFPGLPRRRCSAAGSRVSSLLIFSSEAEGTRGAQTLHPLCVSEVASDSHLDERFEEKSLSVKGGKIRGVSWEKFTEENLAAPYVRFLCRL